MSNDKAVFISVDTDTLPTSVKAKYLALQKANAAAAEAKADFEAAFITAARKAERIDGDISLAFGYRFGKLAIAKVDPSESRVNKSSKPKFTF